MKILSLFIILTLSFHRLSAQDTIPATHPVPSKETSSGDGHIHDTVYIEYDVSSKKLITDKYLLHLRNKAIILSSVGGASLLGGAGIIIAGTRPGISGDPQVSDIGFGSLLIVAGVSISLAGMGSWIYYGVKRHKYKKQQEQGDMLLYDHR